MPPGDYLILMYVGGGFIILGLAGIFWGRHEEKAYFDSLAARDNDLREFMAHWPQRPQPGAWKVGGWIAASIGLLMLVIGSIFWLTQAD